MATVFIDINMFSDRWFQHVLSELISNENVRFSYSESAKMLNEISSVRQALAFYNRIKDMKDSDKKKRRIDAPKSDCDKHDVYLQAQDCFIKCGDCDDPHIFALVYVKPTPYIFSRDARLARCRDHINKKLDKRYCDFIVISEDKVYKVHRHNIFS